MNKSEIFKGMKKTERAFGKNYAISDIHGMYGSYMEVMKKLKKEDCLYIIGDVIDRGEHGIDIIDDIIKNIQTKKSIYSFY